LRTLRFWYLLRVQPSPPTHPACPPTSTSTERARPPRHQYLLSVSQSAAAAAQVLGTRGHFISFFAFDPPTHWRWANARGAGLAFIAATYVLLLQSNLNDNDSVHVYITPLSRSTPSPYPPTLTMSDRHPAPAYAPPSASARHHPYPVPRITTTPAQNSTPTSNHPRIAPHPAAHCPTSSAAASTSASASASATAASVAIPPAQAGTARRSPGRQLPSPAHTGRGEDSPPLSASAAKFDPADNYWDDVVSVDNTPVLLPGTGPGTGWCRGDLSSDLSGPSISLPYSHTTSLDYLNPQL
jgi:hypothetical protein